MIPVHCRDNVPTVLLESWLLETTLWLMPELKLCSGFTQIYKHYNLYTSDILYLYKIYLHFNFILC